MSVVKVVEGLSSSHAWHFRDVESLEPQQQSLFLLRRAHTLLTLDSPI